MSTKIHQLPTNLVNQIAAGEVIERPASVVKELLENALDASANHIILDLSFGGMNAITVSDDGVGISAEDLPLAIAPHATSKIFSLNDLNALATMGFRGEALASIASVSRFTIQSRPQAQTNAMALTMEDEQIRLAPCARDQGTTVMVRDLFYNTPVRRRFLGTEKTEFLAIDKLVRCFALSTSHIKLDFYHQGSSLFQLPSGDTDALRLHRMQKVMGKSFVESAIPIQATHTGLRIEGWIARPTFARSQQDRMWTYVNRRMVNDKLLNHAIKQAYEGKLPMGRFPACLVYIDINPDEVDVNVHPTKHELRFHQPRWVHDALRSAIEHALNEALPVESIKPTLEKKTPQGTFQSLAGALKFDWLTLNSEFALLHQGAHSFLLHFKAFYQAYLRAQLKEVGLPLAERPLFVPVRVHIAQRMSHLEETLICLAQFGLSLSWLGSSELLVRSLPIMMPHLDLQAFITHILTLNELTTSQVIETLLIHQSINLGVVSEQEKEVWMDFLERSSLDAVYLQTLTPQRCEVLFDV